MFAGAAREAVFSNPDVIRRVNADFVPVALKAGLVNSPPDDEEGRLYREIGRSKIAPQGICVINSAGKVLVWATSFDDDESVLAFLDHARKRFAKYPDAKQPVAAERYTRFPSQRGADVEDNGKAPEIVGRHPDGKDCPASPRVRPGTLRARLFGRALDKDGKPVADARRQEDYVEDRFHVPVAMQEALAKALEGAGGDRFRLSDDLARLLVGHAFLGQLDVNPLDAPGGTGDLRRCEFWAERVGGAGDDRVRVRIRGESEAVGSQGDSGRRVDGRLWRHEVKLTWEGIVEMKKDRMSRLLLTARGSERLKWGNQGLDLEGRGDVRRLPAGHAIDLRCGVRYGIIGEPVPDEETGGAGGAPDATRIIPDEARKQLLGMLGGSFIVFGPKAQEELKLSDEQKERLLGKLPDYLLETMKVLEKLRDAKPEEREMAVQSHRRKSDERLAALLKETLNAAQLKRLRQLELQQQGLFNLGRPEIAKELRLTDGQRTQFMGVVRDMQRKVEPLIEEARSGGNPQEVGPKMMRVRKDHEDKIRATLTDAQKAQWKEMIGNAFDPDD